jgi:hypothetical protein
MIVRWALTATFTLSGTYCLLRCGHFLGIGRRHQASAWATELGHLGMSGAMVAMLWSSIGWDRWSVRLAAFSTLAGWFAVCAFVGAVVPAAARSAGGASQPALLYETAAFASMGWMVIQMAGSSQAGSGNVMAMSTTTSRSTGGAVAITLGLAGVLIVSAVGWLWRLGYAVNLVGLGTGHPHRPRFFGAAGEAACQTAMAAGMALALLTLL